MAHNDPVARQGHVSISLRALALGSLMVTIASLTTLAIVVTVKEVDTLSTVALVLAILAFVVQLIVFIVQSADSSRVLDQSQALHGQMMSVLAQVQERATGTQKSVDTINAKLIEAIVGKANSEGVLVSSPEFAQEVVAAVTEPTGETSPELSPSDASARIGPSDRGTNRPRSRAGLDWPDPLPESEAAKIRIEMSTWPDPKEFEEVKHHILELDDRNLRRIYGLATDLLASTAGGNVLGPGLSSGLDDDLTKTGLVEKVPGFKLGTLSPLGRRVARILTAEGEAPPGLAQYAPLRKKAEYLQAEMEASARNRE